MFIVCPENSQAFFGHLLPSMFDPSVPFVRKKVQKRYRRVEQDWDKTKGGVRSGLPTHLSKYWTSLLSGSRSILLPLLQCQEDDYKNDMKL